MTFKYFVSYSWSNIDTGQHGFGNCSVERPAPITDAEDMTAIGKAIEASAEHLANVAVLYWRPFELPIIHPIPSNSGWSDYGIESRN